MFLRPEPDLGWFPTHVQVTILQARGLRAKGKQGTSDAYTLISIGREKYSTSVVEKTPGSPEWKEECSFELFPGALERGENCDLQLTVMHRALIGMDQFLGQVLVPLQQVYQEGRSQRNQWYKLRSKPGKKEKERGEIQVSIQFTRNSLTASMIDLSKGKSKTPFGKLKEKMKGKKHLNMESSSAIVPSSIGRLDSDDEDEKKPKSKATAFFKGLRKSSLTRSNTSLGSDSTISSTSGTVPISTSTSFTTIGTVPSISIVMQEEVKKPAARNSSLSSEPSGVDFEASPRMTHKRAFSDEVSQVNMFPEPKAVQNLKPKSSPISKSSVCINGSHVYTEVPLPKPSPSLEKSTPASRSFQNILKKAEEAIVPEVLTRQVYTTEKQEHKPATPPAAVPEEKTSSKPAAPRLIADQAKAEIKPVQVTSPMVFTEEVSKNKGLEVKARDEKGRESPKPGYIKDEMFGKDLEDPRSRVPSGSEDRSKVGGWFGSKNSKDTPQKPSFLSGSVATSEAAERGSALVEEHSPAEDQKNPSLYQKGTRLGEAFNNHHHHYMDSSSGSAETVSDHHYIDSSPASPETVSEWEEQFDAFASSRLQKSPETKENDLFSDFETNPLQLMFGVPVSGVPSVRQSYSEDSHFNRPWTQVPSNLWANTAEYSRERTEERSFPESHSANFPTSCIPNLESAVACTLTKKMAANEFTNCSTMQNQLEQHPCVEALIPKPSPIKIKYVEANQTEIEVASVSPLSKDHTSVSWGGTSYSPVSKNIPPLQKNDHRAMTSIAESSHEPFGSTDIVVEEVRASVEPTKQALIGNNFIRVGEDLSPDSVDNERTPVEERVTELITEQGISDNIDLAPSKPPQLKLSHAIECTEPDVDNCKQTSLQEANRKQTGSPEEHEPEQNMGIGKQIVSPVTRCPVIEISPALVSTTEDTQSTTEGPLTNLGDNDECKKLGATNGEHLLDVNETSAVEQFRTCPSNVSLDFSSLQESSNKLELISPAEPHSTGCGKNLEDFVFQKPMPLPKKQKHNSTDGSSASKRYDHSDVLFWSALEDQVQCSLANAEHDQQNVGVQLENKEISSQSLECRADPEHHKSEGFKSPIVVSNSPPPNEVTSTKPQSNVKVFKEEESQPSTLLSQESLWSADIIVDFKNEDFWRIDSDQVSQNEMRNQPSPGNPFTPTNQAPLSPKNPFVDHSRGCSDDLSFKHLHDLAAVREFPSAGTPADAKAPHMHGNHPLAFSTPSFAITPNPKPSSFPSPIQFSSASEVTTTTDTLTATLSCFHSPAASGATSPAPAVLPQETQPSENPFMPLENSPHPVKPISAAPPESGPEGKTHKPTLSAALSSGLEMLKTATTGQQPAHKKQDPDRLKDLSPDMAAKYYHLTHDELIHMLLQREAELHRAEGHVQELENYIDMLLVRIMDQAPALLQAPLETKK